MGKQSRDSNSVYHPVCINIREGDKLTCDLDDDKIILKKVVSTTEMFESFYQKPFSEITVSDFEDGGEIDWGDDVGGECL